MLLLSGNCSGKVHIEQVFCYNKKGENKRALPEVRNAMKICYNCFHEMGDSMRFCENCGNNLGDQDNSGFPGALPCGTTLYGRYLTGRVLNQDRLLITYIAQDSRTGETAAIREFFPEGVCERNSSTTVYVPDQLRSVFLEGKDLFLQEAETLSDLREESGQSTGIQSFFNQNNTAYLVIEYTDAASLQDYLKKTDIRNFRREASHLLFTGTDPADDSRAGISDRENLSFSRIPANPVKETVPKDTEDDLKESLSFTPKGDLKDIPKEPPKDNPKDSLKKAQGAADNKAAVPNETNKIENIPPENGSAAYKIETSPPENGSAAFSQAENGRVGFERNAPVKPVKKGQTSLLPFAGVIAAFFVCVALIVLLVFRISSGLGDTLQRGPFDRYFFHRIFREIPQIYKRKVNNKDNKTTDNKTTDSKKDWFTPRTDIPADEEGEDGITAGNFYNSGTFALYDGDCFFIDSHGLNRWPDSDPDDSELLTHGATSFLNVWQDHLYYINEYENQVLRCDPDGRHETIVLDPPADSQIKISTLYIRGNWCYFSSGHNLYRILMEELEGKEAGDIGKASLITDDYNAQNYVYPSLCFVGQRIFYNGADGLCGIYPDGFDKIVISDHTGYLFTDGTSVFCDFGVSQIYRIGEDGVEEEILDFDDLEIIRQTNFCDGQVYYILRDEEEYELWRTAPDGSDQEYVESFGNAEDSLISFCVFPGDEYAYIYWLKDREDGGLLPVGAKYLLNP